MQRASFKGIMRYAISVVALAGKGDGLDTSVAFFGNDKTVPAAAVGRVKPDLDLIEAGGCQGV